jgi:hypothetical protein
MNTVDFPGQVWAYIFAAAAVALVIGLRVTDRLRQRKH